MKAKLQKKFIEGKSFALFLSSEEISEAILSPRLILRSVISNESTFRRNTAILNG